MLLSPGLLRLRRSAAASAPISVSALATEYNTGTGSFSVTTVAAAGLAGSFQAPAYRQRELGGYDHCYNEGNQYWSGFSDCGCSSSFDVRRHRRCDHCYGSVSCFCDYSWRCLCRTLHGLTLLLQTGTLTFSGSASGTAQYSGLTVATGSVGPSNTVTINTPPPPPPETTLPPTSLSVTSGTIASGTVTT